MHQRTQLLSSNVVMVFYLKTGELFTDPVMLIYPTIEPLDVRKIELALCCFNFFPPCSGRGIKERDYAISEVIIGLYFSVAFE